MKEVEYKNNSNKQAQLKPMKKTINFVMKTITIIGVTIVIILSTLFLTLKMICSDFSKSAKELFVTTILETGQMKFLASMFVSPEEIKEIINNNSMNDLNIEEDLDLIQVLEADDDINAIELKKVSGNTFAGKMLIIKDPSRVKLATTYPWSEFGSELEVLVNKSGAVAGVNGGLYQSSGNKGGYPLGVVVCEGEIQYNKPVYTGLYLIGFDSNNI